MTDTPSGPTPSGAETRREPQEVRRHDDVVAFATQVRLRIFAARRDKGMSQADLASAVRPAQPEPMDGFRPGPSELMVPWSAAAMVAAAALDEGYREGLASAPQQEPENPHRAPAPAVDRGLVERIANIMDDTFDEVYDKSFFCEDDPDRDLEGSYGLMLAAAERIVAECALERAAPERAGDADG